MNLEKAKALFAEAGVDGSQEISIIVYDTKASKYAQVLQNSLAEIGLKAMYLRWNAPPMTTRA